MGIIKIIGNLGKGIKVGTTTKIITITSLGIEIRVGDKTVIEGEKMTIRMGVNSMFNQGTEMLIVAI